MEAYNKWKDNNYKGTISAATASGKTYLFSMTIEQHPMSKILIVVPTIALQQQHILSISKDLNLPVENFGKVGDGFKQWNRKIVVAVINSIRFTDLKEFDIVLLDECHRYFSEVNTLFLYRTHFEKVMAVSATPEREDAAHKQFMKIFPIVYEIGAKELIDANILSKFTVENVGLELTGKQKEVYDVVDADIKKRMPHYGNNIHNILAYMRTGDKDDATDAADLMRKITQRRMILLKAQVKVDKLVKYIAQTHIQGHTKALIFNEYIEVADEIYRRLKAMKVKCGIYHSKLHIKERRQMLEDFRNDEFNILVGVKCLDEGLDVPAVNEIHIIGGSSVKRQTIQRIGRGLRAQDGKQAKVIQYYIKDSQDEVWLRKRTQPFVGVAESIVWR